MLSGRRIYHRLMISIISTGAVTVNTREFGTERRGGSQGSRRRTDLALRTQQAKESEKSRFFLHYLQLYTDTQHVAKEGVWIHWLQEISKPVVWYCRFNKKKRVVCVVLEKPECTEKCGEVPGHCRDRGVAECAQNSQHPVLDQRVMKGLPAHRCCMDKVVSPRYQTELGGGNTAKAEMYKLTTDKPQRKSRSM